MFRVVSQRVRTAEPETAPHDRTHRKGAVAIVAQPQRTRIIRHAPSLNGHPLRPLPARWIDLLREGDTRGDYRSRSEAAMALALAAVNAGWQHADWHAALTDPSNTLAGWALTRPNGAHRSPRDTNRRIQATWDKAVARVLQQPPVRERREILARLADIQHAADTWHWTGRNARRDRDTLTDLLARATEAGTLAPSISTRHLTERGRRHSHRTTASALQSLANLGWVRIEQPDRPTHAPRYHLNIPAPETSGQPLHTGVSPEPREDSVQSRTTNRSDLLDGLALVTSPLAADLYAALDQSPASARELARRIGSTHPTVIRWLPRLMRLGLAARSGGGWFRGPGSVADVTCDDAREARARRASRHAGDRARWEAARAHWAAQRDAVRGRARVRCTAWREANPEPARRALSEAEMRRDWMAVADEKRRAAA